jgi:hypothetical protein
VTTVVREADATTGLWADDVGSWEAHDGVMTITRRTNRCDIVLTLIDECLGEYERMLAASHVNPATQSRKESQTCSV